MSGFVGGIFLALLALAGLWAAWWRDQRRTSGTPFVRVKHRSFLGTHSTIRIRAGRWRNWSRELTSVPGRIYCDMAGSTHAAPRSLHDLQAIVREARALGVQVRAFGSSHSWASLVPVDGGFLVDNRMIGAVGDRYDLSVEPASPDGTRKARATGPPGLISKEFEEWPWDIGYTYTFEVEPRYEVVSDAFVVSDDSPFADTDAARLKLRALHEAYSAVELFW